MIMLYTNNKLYLNRKLQIQTKSPIYIQILSLSCKFSYSKFKNLWYNPKFNNNLKLCFINSKQLLRYILQTKFFKPLNLPSIAKIFITFIHFLRVNFNIIFCSLRVFNWRLCSSFFPPQIIHKLIWFINIHIYNKYIHINNIYNKYINTSELTHLR